MFILEQRYNRLGYEEALLREVAIHRNIPVKYVVEKHAARGMITFEDCTLVAGSVPFLKHVLRTLGKPLPAENSYPACLNHLLYREVKKLKTLREAKAFLDKGTSFFIKPADLKRFTGFVTQFSDDFRFLGCSEHIPAYISTTVTFLSEWRCYVANGKLLDVKFANNGGDRKILPDMHVIEAAVRTLTDAKAPAGYAVDFGVLDTGQTALVELNDGFALGAYDNISGETYMEVIQSRWKELVA